MKLIDQYLQLFSVLSALYIFSFLLINITLRESDRGFLLKVIGLSFILNTSTVIIVSEFLRSKFGAPFLPGIDIWKFNKISWQMAQSDRILGVEGLSGPAIYVLNAGIFQYFGQNPLIIRGVYVFLVCLSAIFSYKIAKDLFGKTPARYAAIFVALYPNFFIYSALPHREILVTFFGVFTVWYFLLAIRHLKLIGFFLGSIGLLLLYWSRSELSIIILFVILLYLVYRRIGIDWIQKGLIVVISVSLLISLGVFIKRSGPGQERGLNLFSPAYLARELEEIKRGQRRFDSEGLGSYLLYASYPERLIIGFPFMLIKPFPPWKTLSMFAHSTFTTPGTLVWYLLMPFSFIGMVEAFRNFQKDYMVIILIPFFVLAAAALAYGAETARYRVQIMPYLLVFAGLGFSIRKKYHQAICLYIIAFFGGVVLYLILKTLGY